MIAGLKKFFSPSDGSARLNEDGGNCNCRVIRSGSRVSESQDLRSTFRGRVDTDVADDLGFRAVRDF